MRIRSAGQVQRIGLSVVFILAFLACDAAIASDDERQVRVIQDTDGSGLTLEISREGNRRTATPSLALYDPTVQRIEDRVAKKVTRFDAKEMPSRAADAGSLPRIGATGTPREENGWPETTLSSLPAVPGEITIRSVKGFLKSLRSSRKEKPAPAAVVAVPEQRLGMADTSPR